MDINIIKSLLIEINHLAKHHEKMAQASGENFNVFKILNLQASEVRTHSTFLAELLSPNGSHGQGDLFLRLFVKQFDIENFDTKTAYTDVEKYTGLINEDYSEGGRIDILITDGNGKCIIIENKIYAVDQANQLLRYYNFDKNAHLFYLTLTGSAPSESSTGGLLHSNYFKTISYRSDIIEWLENCKKEAVSLPIIRESIAQYIYLLKALTNQTTMDKMKEEISQLLAKHPEYIDAIETGANALNAIVWETRAKFEKLLNERFTFTPVTLDVNSTIEFIWAEDEGGIYFGYTFKKSGELANESKQGVIYSDILKEAGSQYQIESNTSHIGWFTPIYKSKKLNMRFVDFDKQEIVKMYADENYLKSFVDELVNQEKEIRGKFLNQMKPFAQSGTLTDIVFS